MAAAQHSCSDVAVASDAAGVERAPPSAEGRGGRSWRSFSRRRVPAAPGSAPSSARRSAPTPCHYRGGIVCHLSFRLRDRPLNPRCGFISIIATLLLKDHANKMSRRRFEREFKCLCLNSLRNEQGQSAYISGKFFARNREAIERSRQTYPSAVSYCQTHQAQFPRLQVEQIDLRDIWPHLRAVNSSPVFPR